MRRVLKLGESKHVWAGLVMSKCGNASQGNMSIKKLPEWKQLYTAIKPLIAKQTLFTYEELSALCGADVQGIKGRQQFHRFRDQALKDWLIWFENERGVGYKIVRPDEHGICANTRMKAARRRVKSSIEILVHTKVEELSNEQRIAHSNLIGCTGAIMQAMQNAKKELRQSAVAMTGALPMPTFKQLLP